MFILFILIVANSGPVIHQTEFNSVEACEVAKSEVIKIQTKDTYVYCFAKGKK